MNFESQKILNNLLSQKNSRVVMKSISQITYSLLFFLFSLTSAMAQVQTNANQLDQEFEGLKGTSNSVKSASGREYKVVNLQDLNSLWNDVQGLLSASKDELEATQSKVDALNQEVSKLTERVDEQQVIVQESEHAATHISVLGLDVPKDKFVATFWITTAVLLVLLAGAIYQYKRGRDVTNRTQMNFMELQEEMVELRKTSLEKERRLRRELQTERNTMEEMGRNPHSYKR